MHFLFAKDEDYLYRTIFTYLHTRWLHNILPKFVEKVNQI